MDTINGTSGNDAINAAVGTDGTFTAADVINGGDGADTLNVVDVASGGTNFGAALLNVLNIETLAVRGVDDLNVQAATVAFTTVKTTQSVDSTVVANAASNVEVSGATGAIAIDGGNNVTIIDATSGKAITVGASAAAKGTVTVTDSKVGAAAITIDGAAVVNVTASEVGIVASANYDTTKKAAVLVGQTTAIAGNVDVTATGATVVKATDATRGDIVVTATGNISVNQVAYGINTATATDTTGATMTQGIVDVVGGDSTSSITIKQSANVAEAVYVKAVAAKAATTTITFKALAATESVSRVYRVLCKRGWDQSLGILPSN